MLLQNPLSVDELLRRDISFHWFESVALVQALCRQLHEAGRGDGGFPAPSDILLGADGVVSVLRVPGGSDGVASAARLLSAMQGDDVPVQLRLLVAQATKEESEIRTLGDFSSALAFFERPDSRQVLRQLHERGSAASPTQDRTSAFEQAPVERKQQAEQAAKPKRDDKKPAKSPLLVALPVATLACAAVWLFGFGMGDAATNPVSPEGQAVEAPGPDRAASGPLEVERPGSASTSGRPAAGASSRTAPARSNASMLAMRTWLGPLIGARETAPATVPPELVSYESIEVTASPVPGVRPTPDAERLYSDTDSRVVPPRAVYPKLPESDDSAGPRTVLELVIATDGLVERVRMRSEPRNVHEFMLVSAAKAWRFEPATLDGWPVRFVHRIALPRP